MSRFVTTEIFTPQAKFPDLVSVIVPVYNAEKYLPYCIRSIREQTHENLQIILVDDGSTDSSGKICDAYAKKDRRIEVIHRKNGGIASAQNAGLDHVRGDFVAFCDNDDLLAPYNISMLLWALKETNAGMAKGRWYTIGARHIHHVLKFQEKMLMLDRPQKVELTFIPDPLFAYETVFPKILRLLGGRYVEARYFNEANWGRLYRTDVWKNIRFQEGTFAQDIRISGRLYCAAHSVVDVDKHLYFWMQNSESVTHQERTMQFSTDNVNANAEAFVWALNHHVLPCRNYYGMYGSLLYEEFAKDRHTPNGRKMKKHNEEVVRSTVKKLSPLQHAACLALYILRLGDNLIYDHSLRKRR